MTPQKILAKAVIAPKKKYVKMGALALLFGGGAYAVSKLFNRTPTNKRENNSRLAQLAKMGIYPTVSDSTYAAWADSIFRVMTGMPADEAPNSVLWSILDSVKNEADWVKVKLAYGVRQLSFLFFKEGRPMTLVEALASEKLFSKTQSILKSKNINI